MKRPTESTRARLSRLTREEQVHFLVSLAQGVTITTRGAYQDAAPERERIKVFVTLNEVQHQICGKLLDSLGAKPLSYSDDDFIENILAIVGERYRAALEWDIEHAFGIVERQDVAG